MAGRRELRGVGKAFPGIQTSKICGARRANAEVRKANGESEGNQGQKTARGGIREAEYHPAILCLQRCGDAR